MNSQFVSTDKIQIAEPLYDLVNNEIIPGTGIDQEGFWISLSQIIEKLSEENRQLLTQRTQMQSQIDEWHKDNRTYEFDRDILIYPLV